MQLLNIFHTGGITLFLSLIAFVITFLYWRQIPKAMKQPYGKYNHATGKWEQLAPRTRIDQINKFWIGLIPLLLLAIVLIFIVGPDYKDV